MYHVCTTVQMFYSAKVQLIDQIIYWQLIFFLNFLFIEEK